jgi:hypothetical protein
MANRIHMDSNIAVKANSTLLRKGYC